MEITNCKRTKTRMAKGRMITKYNSINTSFNPIFQLFKLYPSVQCFDTVGCVTGGHQVV